MRFILLSLAFFAFASEVSAEESTFIFELPGRLEKLEDGGVYTVVAIESYTENGERFCQAFMNKSYDRLAYHRSYDELFADEFAGIRPMRVVVYLTDTTVPPMSFERFEEELATRCDEYTF